MKQDKQTDETEQAERRDKTSKADLSLLCEVANFTKKKIDAVRQKCPYTNPLTQTPLHKPLAETSRRKVAETPRRNPRRKVHRSDLILTITVYIYICYTMYIYIYIYIYICTPH